ncbi:MAG TPA: hypothetical protein DIW24_02700 [Bacteroidetes bacterium]|nr:hypothetical protein [Bacteroidota bacterium]HRR09659.1 hypothetical protein [Rhodothermales bacterium]
MTKKFISALLFAVLAFVPACDLVNGHEEHTEAEGFSIYKGSTEVIRYFDGKIESGGKISLALNATDAYTVKWLDADKKEITTLEEGSSLHISSTNSTIFTVAADGAWGLKVTGKKAGTSDLEVGLLHEGHFDFAKRTIPVEVK